MGLRGFMAAIAPLAAALATGLSVPDRAHAAGAAYQVDTSEVSEAGNCKAVGEASVTYLTSPGAESRYAIVRVPMWQYWRVIRDSHCTACRRRPCQISMAPPKVLR